MKPNVKEVIGSVQTTLGKYSPEILIGIGLAGMATSTVLAVRATPKAIRLLEEAKEEKQEELTKKEVVKATWKCYIPTVTTGVIAAACIIGANSVNVKRNAALATAYKISETAFSEYRDKVIETVGEKKEKVVKEKVMQKRLDEKPVDKAKVIVTGKGTVTCRDSISGRDFTTSVDAIKKAEIAINKKLVSGPDGYASLNDFYSELGLNSIDIGNDLGWTMDDSYVEIEFCSLFDEDLGEAVIVLYYSVAPRRGYSRYW